MIKFRQASAGFVLIEVALAMIIFSLCLGGILTVLTYSKKAQQQTTTQTHYTVVSSALNRYYRTHGHLPCPSSPAMGDGFALERCQGALQQIGLVPHKTLGIPASFIKDGQGYYFTYAVSERSTITDSTLRETTTTNPLIVIDADDTPYRTGVKGIAYILISHGQKGSGAFSNQSARRRLPTESAFEAENARDTLTFYGDAPANKSEHSVFFVLHDDLTAPPTSLSQTTIGDDDAENAPYGLLESD